MLNVKLSRENNAKFVSLRELMEDLAVATVEVLPAADVLLVLKWEQEYYYIYLGTEGNYEADKVYRCDGIHFPECRLYPGKVTLANRGVQ